MYALKMALNYLSMFVSSLFELVDEVCWTAILIKDIGIYQLMTRAYLKDRR